MSVAFSVHAPRAGTCRLVEGSCGGRRLVRRDHHRHGGGGGTLAHRLAEYFRRALAIRQKSLGPEHPETSVTLHDEAELERWQGNPQAAVPLYRQALAIREKAYGGNHPEVAQSLHGLALALLALGEAGAGLPLTNSGWRQPDVA